MVEPSGSRQHVGDSSARPPNKKVSVMRRFLESGVDFEWPEGVGERDGKHCDLDRGSKDFIPLKFKSKIYDKNASIDIYVGTDQYAFKETFVVKTIREATYLKSKKKAQTEVHNMKDLRYPHVAALLGTFTYRERLSILIFPAAPCDLHRFLKTMSREMRDIRRGRNPWQQELATQHARAETPDSRSSTSSVRDGPSSPEFSTHSLNSLHRTRELEEGPLRLALPAKVESLRGFFVCLAQALSYLHESGVRHKDIKPENILIDASGQIVLTDFGISRRFPKKVPHVTNDKWEYTHKYASPEIMRGKKQPRDDPSDVFSLGCVFLEMASLILGRDLVSMCEHYAAPINDSGREEAYYRNLERVYTWIELLEKSWDPEPRSEPRSAPDLTDEKIKGQDFMPDPNSGLIEALATIRYMLDIDPPRRPKAQGLWENFQHVSSQKCRDCDPRHDECWKPNREQRDAVETGTARRRSMQLIPEEASDNPSTETRDGQPENENFLSANYRRDRSSLTGRRASSPHAERIQTYLSRPYNSMPEHGPPPAVASALASSSLSTEDGTRIRRISSATDGRRAYTHENPTGSRSMSPTKRRPVSESQVRYSAVQGPDSSVPLSPPKRDRSLHPPPASRNDRLPVTQDSMGSSPSLAVKKQTARSEDAGAQEKSGTNKHAYHQKQEILLPITQVIVYDLAKKLAYVTAFAQLESMVSGRDYISRPLPRSGQHIEIGEKGSPIATVDLGTLDWMTKAKRWMGAFPTLYVLNFGVQPG